MLPMLLFNVVAGLVTDKAQDLVDDYPDNAAKFADSALKSENLIKNL